MKDLFHSFTKAVSHNRFVGFGSLILAVSSIVPACAQFDGRVASSRTGELVSVDEIRAEAVQADNELQDRYDAAAAQIAAGNAEIEAVNREAEKLAEGIQVDLDAANSEIEARNGLLGQVGELVTQSASAAYAPWISFGLAAVTGGALLDNRRKDKVIATKSASAAT